LPRESRDKRRRPSLLLLPWLLRLSRDSVQSHARIKAELALCLLRGEVSARLGDIVDTATRLLDRQHRRPSCRIDVQRRRLCRVGAGSGAVRMPIAEDDSSMGGEEIVSRSNVATPATVIARVPRASISSKSSSECGSFPGAYIQAMLCAMTRRTPAPSAAEIKFWVP